MSQTVIGLDIGHYSIKALRLQVTYKGFEAIGFDQEVLDTVTASAESLQGDGETEISEGELDDAIHDAEDEALRTALIELAERGALDGDIICVTLPPDLVLSSRLSFPFVDARTLQAAIPAQFEERIPMDIDELLLHHNVIGASKSEEGMHDILVNATKREDLEIYLDRWRAGGVDPHHVLMGDAEMTRLGRYLLPEATEPYAIVDIGHRFTRVVCVEVDESGKLIMGYTRSFEFGGQDINAALAEVLSCSRQEAEHFKHSKGFVSVATLAHGIEEVKVSDGIKRSMDGLLRELRRTFQAHMDERREPVQRVYLCGGTSRLRGLASYLTEQIGAPFETLPLAGSELATLNMSKPELMAQALALGLSEVPTVKVDLKTDFRTGRYEHKGAKGWFREKVLGLGILVALLLCALGSVFVTKYYAVSLQHDTAKQALEQSTERLFGEKMTSEKKVKKALGGGDSGSSIIPKRSAYTYFYEVFSRQPDGVKMEFIELEVDLFRQLIKVQAETDSAANVDPFVEALEGYECYKGKVQKGNTNASGDKVKFDLTIAPECPGSGSGKKKKKK